MITQCDSQETIFLAKNETFAKTIYVDVKYYFIHKLVKATFE